MARTQIMLEPEIQRRARQRASDMGISFAEYVRRLVVRDVADAPRTVDPAVVFDLGDSKGSDISRNKASMVAEAFAAARKKEHSTMILPSSALARTGDELLRSFVR